MRQLTLTARELNASESTIQWHWRLLTPGGKLEADFPVRLDTASPEYRALSELTARPAGSSGDAAGRALDTLGDWLAAAVLGRVATRLAEPAMRPCAVRLWQDTPAPLDVTGWPYELARVNGKALARLDVSFVVAPDGPPPGGIQVIPAPEPVAARPLRVLGLFSLPDGEQTLNLNRERRELERLVATLTDRDVSLTTLQYGTTRAALREALDEGAGWDVVHLSGHGRAGMFVLEKPDGSADRVTEAGLVALLEPLSNRVRLLTVSACESAERAGRRELAFLPGGVPVGSAADADGGLSAGLGEALASRLNCAVLAMRYPVAESFAAEFTQELYRLMLKMGVPLPLARARAATRAAPAAAADPPLSLITPALYGFRGLELDLRAPDRDGPRPYSYKLTKLAGVPDRPFRFTGRSGPMTRLGQALARESDRGTVVIEGMEGVGKTALALETAHGQARNFDVVAWYQCGADGERATDGLAELLGTKIPNLNPAPLLGSDAEARAGAAELSAYFAATRALIVLDGVDTQLTEAGQWADERLALLVRALAVGQTRLLVTTRLPLADPGQWSRAPVTVRLTPLPDAEAALLASDFPGLKALQDGGGRSLRPPLDAVSARALAAGVQAVTRGHPGLLAMAEAHARDPITLSTMVITARGFWAARESEPGSEAPYLEALRAWRSNPPAPE